jgi:hypothetical protein
LHLAAKAGSQRMAIWLIRKGANIHSLNEVIIKSVFGCVGIIACCVLGSMQTHSHSGDSSIATIAPRHSGDINFVNLNIFANASMIQDNGTEILNSRRKETYTEAKNRHLAEVLLACKMIM